MGLIVLLSFLPFQVLSSTKSNCRYYIANDEWPPVHPISFHWTISFGGNAGVSHKLQPKPKTVPEFKDALQLIWPSLAEKAINNAVKDYHKRLQACVSANGWTV